MTEDHRQNLLRRLNGEETVVEKVFRLILGSVIWLLVLAVLAGIIVLLVEALVLHVEIPAIHFGLLWWLIGALVVSISVWMVNK